VGEAGTVHIRKVLVTRDLGTQVEVTDGVKQGDEVVMNPPVTQASTRAAALRDAIVAILKLAMKGSVKASMA
jgi:hypothetical protein